MQVNDNTGNSATAGAANLTVIRFLADADLNEGIVTGCLRREPSMDFLAANEANLEGVPDRQMLALAAERNRILVSHDFQTMPAALR